MTDNDPSRPEPWPEEDNAGSDPWAFGSHEDVWRPGQKGPDVAQPGHHGPGYGPPPPGYAPAGYGAPPPYPWQGALTPDERMWGMLSHLLGIFAPLIGPIIIMAIKGKESPFIHEQSVESVNFQITLLISSIVCFALMFVIIGFLLMPVLWITALVFMIMGSVKANQGERFRYPINIRFTS